MWVVREPTASAPSHDNDRPPSPAKGRLPAVVPALESPSWPRLKDHATVGWSTGFLTEERGRWPALARRAAEHSTLAAELSALSEPELPGLVDYLSSDDALPFLFLSIHGPSKKRELPESELVDILADLRMKADVVVLHPDAMHDVSQYRRLGTFLAVENMDSRKDLGQTVEQLEPIMAELPDARLCFDVAHAKDIDPSMHEGMRILDRWRDRLSHVHVSSLDSSCHHIPLTPEDKRLFAPLLDRCRDVPWILEAAPLDS